MTANHTVQFRKSAKGFTCCAAVESTYNTAAVSVSVHRTLASVACRFSNLLDTEHFYYTSTVRKAYVKAHESCMTHKAESVSGSSALSKIMHS